MRPILIKDVFKEDLFPVLRDEVAWQNRDAPRDECFMAAPGAPRTYSYGNDNQHRTDKHTYHAVDGEPLIRYNVCVLNYYKDEHQHLGWHSDDSPEQDLDHPISVVAFGAAREIWVRKIGDKGVVPPEDRFVMEPGSVFVMPGGFQGVYQHRIPKHSKPCGGRISLTFRKLVR